jgi:peptidyl-prolyl cis-trans isomerase C
MKRVGAFGGFHHRVVYVLFAFAVLVSSCDSFRQTEEKVVLTVGSTEITVEQLKKEIKRMTYEMETRGKLAEDVLEPLVNRITERYLILEYGKDEGIVISEGELDAAVKEIRKAYSEKDFQEMLLQGYIDFDDWKEGIRERLLMKKIMEDVSGDMTAVSFQEIKAYYDAHPEEFNRPAQVKFRQTVTGTKAEAVEILRRLNDGEDMGELIMESSKKPGMENVGQPTWIDRDSLELAMGKVLFSLDVGEISGVVETPYGFHVFQVLEKQPEGTKTLPEAVAEIESKLSCQRKEAFFSTWLQDLRDTIPIKINREVLNTLELG